MKKLTLLILGIIVAITAFCQQPDEAGNVLHKIWPEIELVQPQVGKQHRVLLRKDHALYAENIPDSTWVTICYGCPIIVIPPQDTIPKPDLVFIVDDAETLPYNEYSGPWIQRANAGWTQNFHNKTASFTVDTTATLKVKFTGYKFEWYSEKLANHGIALVQIDGWEPVDVDLYSNTETINNSQLVYTSPNLVQGEHTITIKMSGRKNANATQDNIIHDYVKTYRKQ